MTRTNRHVAVFEDKATLKVVLDRPDVHNALNPEMIQELAEIFGSLEVGGSVRAVVISGNGPSFCAGADLGWMQSTARSSREEVVREADSLYQMLTLVAQSPVPVIAKVHGAAIGGGVGLVSASDIVLAADDATFGFTETRIGLAPAVISPFVLDAIGPRQARALFLTGEKFDARKAERIGLVHEVVNQSELDDTVSSVVETLGKCGPQAMSTCKELIRGVSRLSPVKIPAFVSGLNADLRMSDEGQEGMKAFLERRAPCFADS